MIPADAVFGIFVLASLPLVWQDHRYLGVGWLSLTAFTIVVQGAAVWLLPEFFGRAWQAVAVLACGAAVVLVARDGIGEGDALFAVNLGTMFSGFALLSAMAWGCVAGIAGWGLLALRHPDQAEAPLPLIPALVTGACIEYLLDRMVWW